MTDKVFSIIQHLRLFYHRENETKPNVILKERMLKMLNYAVNQSTFFFKYVSVHGTVKKN